MRRIAWPLLVISSLVLPVAASMAAVRPHYGGTVRIMVREAPASLEPATLASEPEDHILPLIFEGLTRFDSHTRLQPQLATRWQSDNDYRHWQFWLRSGVTFHDGSALTAEAAAAGLHAAHPSWTVNAAADSVVIETDTSTPALPAELALPRNAIVWHAGGKLLGTGPFEIAAWQPGKRLMLHAYDDYWGGRAFADALEITLSQSWRQQMIALELGRAEVVEISPQQVRRAGDDGKTIFQSAPDELLALVFARDPQSDQELHVRQALSAAIDRAALKNVVFQRQGEIADTVLPNWMTGYAFLFAQSEPATQPASRPSGAALTLAYDATDPLSQLIAERVALNARDAGIVVEPAPSTASPDLRLVFIPLRSPDAQIALAVVANAAGLPVPQFQSVLPNELYAHERQLLQSGRIIPLLHVPQAVAVAANLHGWREDQFGAWHLADVWLEASRP